MRLLRTLSIAAAFAGLSAGSAVAQHADSTRVHHTGVAAKSSTKKTAKKSSGSSSKGSGKSAGKSAGKSSSKSGGTSGTSSGASSSGESSSGAGQGATAPGDTRVNEYMSYNSEKKSVTLRLIAADGSTNGGMNFNGGARGNQTIVIPAGWSVKAHVVNKDAIPHSAIIVTDKQPFPAIPSDAAIPRAYSSHVTDGLAPMDGTDDLSFKASKVGDFVVLCGVPGHGQSGMYIKFTVSADAAVPAYKM